MGTLAFYTVRQLPRSAWFYNIGHFISCGLCLYTRKWLSFAGGWLNAFGLAVTAQGVSVTPDMLMHANTSGRRWR